MVRRGIGRISENKLEINPSRTQFLALYGGMVRRREQYTYQPDTPIPLCGKWVRLPKKQGAPYYGWPLLLVTRRAMLRHKETYSGGGAQSHCGAACEYVMMATTSGCPAPWGVLKKFAHLESPCFLDIEEIRKSLMGGRSHPPRADKTSRNCSGEFLNRPLGEG